MYKAIYEMTFATDGSVSEHLFEAWDGTGVGFSKSPKRAMELARKQAHRECGVGGCWSLIHIGWVLMKGTKVISEGMDGLWFTEAL
jgi:hypothetical protein